MNISPKDKMFLFFNQTFMELKNICGALRYQYDIFTCDSKSRFTAVWNAYYYYYCKISELESQLQTKQGICTDGSTCDSYPLPQIKLLEYRSVSP